MKMIEMMLQTHPRADTAQTAERAAVIDALAVCAQACGICADACLGDSLHLDALRPCIQASLDCADACGTTARLLNRPVGMWNAPLHVAQLHACAVACQLCADACDAWADEHSHCRICAEVCAHCKEQCELLLVELASAETQNSEEAAFSS